MSDFRKHLSDLGREYRSARYPGDLADEVLGPRWTIGRWAWNVGAALAAAAAIVLALWLRPAPNLPTVALIDPPTTQEVQATEVSLSEMPAVSVPQLPSEMEMAPTAPDFSFSAPSFSLIGEEKSETTSTTQESV
jgi:hypothetical protein